MKTEVYWNWWHLKILQNGLVDEWRFEANINYGQIYLWIYEAIRLCKVREALGLGVVWKQLDKKTRNIMVWQNNVKLTSTLIDSCGLPECGLLSAWTQHGCFRHFTLGFYLGKFSVGSFGTFFCRIAYGVFSGGLGELGEHHSSSLSILLMFDILTTFSFFISFHIVNVWYF